MLLNVFDTYNWRKKYVAWRPADLSARVSKLNLKI